MDIDVNAMKEQIAEQERAKLAERIAKKQAKLDERLADPDSPAAQIFWLQSQIESKRAERKLLAQQIKDAQEELKRIRPKSNRGRKRAKKK